MSEPEGAAVPAWERLDARMLLLGPVQAVRGFLVPAAVAAVGFGSSDLRRGLVIAGITLVLSLLVGMLPWLTTTYRVTGSALVVRTGVLRRQVLTAPLERVRSVDLEASLLHRLLKLRKVAVGTGVDDGAITLDSLGADAAEALHRQLLSLSAMTAASGDAERDRATDEREVPSSPAAAEPGTGSAAAEPERVLATFDPGWARFAPFSLAPLVVVGGVIGATTQLDLPFWSAGEALWQWVVALSIGVVVLLLLGGGLVLWCAATMVGYLLQWWDLRLVRAHGNLRLTRGLLTTTSTTVEEARIRGVEMSEPVLLRAVGGAKLKALVTGLDDGSYGVLPQAPVAVTREVATTVLRPDPAAPVTMALHSHGPAAQRRALLRGVRRWVAPTAAAAVALWWFERLAWPWGAVAVTGALVWGLFSGWLSHRNLGHALTDEHLVVTAASVTRRRTVLERDGLIGWVLSATWFQRRVGVVDLTATTAAGSEAVVLVDVPRADAEALVRTLTPEWS